MDISKIHGTFVQKAEPRVATSGRIYERVTLKCQYCGKNFDCDYHNAIKKGRGLYCNRSCGNKAKSTVIGGNSKHPLYSRWMILSQRCTNPKNPNYKDYGGRGISIEPYLQEFHQYLNYVLSLPNAPNSFPTKLEIDRIDNDKGYERGNLRWASRSLNMINTRPKQVKKIGQYLNVFYLKRDNLWRVDIRYEGKKYSLGTFKTEEEARQARNQFIIDNNFPHKLV